MRTADRVVFTLLFLALAVMAATVGWTAWTMFPEHLRLGPVAFGVLAGAACCAAIVDIWRR